MRNKSPSPSRRDFIKKSAAAAGAFTLGSACASTGSTGSRGSWGDAAFAPIPKAV